MPAVATVSKVVVNEEHTMDDVKAAKKAAEMGD